MGVFSSRRGVPLLLPSKKDKSSGVTSMLGRLVGRDWWDIEGRGEFEMLSPSSLVSGCSCSAVSSPSSSSSSAVSSSSSSRSSSIALSCSADSRSSEPSIGKAGTLRND